MTAEFNLAEECRATDFEALKFFKKEHSNPTDPFTTLELQNRRTTFLN